MGAKFRPEISELPQILKWVREQIEPAELSDKEKKRVEVALEEAIVNVITHGRPAEIVLECKLELERQIEFILRDDGPPFNPIANDQEDRESDVSLEEREPGGLGISIMRKYMDLLLYRREDDQNILTLIKAINL